MRNQSALNGFENTLSNSILKIYVNNKQKSTKKRDICNEVFNIRCTVPKSYK